MKQRCYHCGIEYSGGAACPECGRPGPDWSHMRPSPVDYVRLFWLVARTARHAVRGDHPLAAPSHAAAHGPSPH